MAKISARGCTELLRYRIIKTLGDDMAAEYVMIVRSDKAVLKKSRTLADAHGPTTPWSAYHKIGRVKVSLEAFDNWAISGGWTKEAI